MTGRPPSWRSLLAVAERLEALVRAGHSTAYLSDQLAYALFFDNSTRTKSAWAGAAARLGMQPVIVDGSSTQVAHGETASETGAMLGMNAHAMGVRHDLILGEGQSFMRELKRGIDEYLAATGDRRAVPIVNLQCDVDHPTQTLADLLWLRERWGGQLAGKKIAVSWAYAPSYAKPLVRAAGPDLAADSLRRPGDAGPPRGLPPARRAGRSRPAPRCRLWRHVPRRRLDGRGVRRCRRRLPEVLGSLRPDAGAGGGQPGGRPGGHEADRAAGAGPEREARGLDLRRAADGPDAEMPCTCTACRPASAPKSPPG